MDRWTPEENELLMRYGHRAPWAQIAQTVGRTVGACQAQYRKIERLRKQMGTWKGIAPKEK
jgi:hypothetical protein